MLLHLTCSKNWMILFDKYSRLSSLQSLLIGQEIINKIQKSIVILLTRLGANDTSHDSAAALSFLLRSLLAGLPALHLCRLPVDLEVLLAAGGVVLTCHLSFLRVPLDGLLQLAVLRVYLLALLLQLLQLRFQGIQHSFLDLKPVLQLLLLAVVLLLLHLQLLPHVLCEFVLLGLQELIEGLELRGDSIALRSVHFQQLAEIVLEVVDGPARPFLVELFVDDFLVEALEQGLVELAGDAVVGLVKFPRLFAEEAGQALERLGGQLKLGEDVLEHEDVLARIEEDLLLLGLDGVPELELVQGQLEVLGELGELVLQALGVAEQRGLQQQPRVSLLVADPGVEQVEKRVAEQPFAYLPVLLQAHFRQPKQPTPQPVVLFLLLVHRLVRLPLIAELRHLQAHFAQRVKLAHAGGVQVPEDVFHPLKRVVRKLRGFFLDDHDASVSLEKQILGLPLRQPLLNDFLGDDQHQGKVGDYFLEDVGPAAEHFLSLLQHEQDGVCAHQHALVQDGAVDVSGGEISLFAAREQLPAPRQQPAGENEADHQHFLFDEFEQRGESFVGEAPVLADEREEAFLGERVERFPEGELVAVDDHPVEQTAEVVPALGGPVHRLPSLHFLHSNCYQYDGCF